MLTTPESNIKYTDDQQAQLESFRTQLLAIQTDVTITSQSLRNLQNEIVRLTKEKGDLESKQTSLQSACTQLQENADSLNKQITESSKLLEDNKIKASTLEGVHQIKQQELDIKESELNDRSTQLVMQKEFLDKSVASHEKEVQSFLVKKEILTKALESL